MWTEVAAVALTDGGAGFWRRQSFGSNRLLLFWLLSFFFHHDPNQDVAPPTTNSALRTPYLTSPTFRTSDLRFPSSSVTRSSDLTIIGKSSFQVPERCHNIPPALK